MICCLPVDAVTDSLKSEFDSARSDSATVVWPAFTATSGDCISIGYNMTSFATRLQVLLTTAGASIVVYNATTFHDKNRVYIQINVNGSYSLELTSDIYFDISDSSYIVSITHLSKTSQTTPCPSGNNLLFQCFYFIFSFQVKRVRPITNIKHIIVLYKRNIDYSCHCNAVIDIRTTSLFSLH